jgi:hypothetical protein
MVLLRKPVFSYPGYPDKPRIREHQKRIINSMQRLGNEIRIGDVLLVEGRSERIRIVQLLTKSAWGHAVFMWETP